MRPARWNFAIIVTALGLTSLPLLDACGGEQVTHKTAAVKAGDMPEAGSWTGVFFNPQFGHLHMVHTGSSISGKWKTADGSAWGELNGNVIGNLLHFEWKEHKIGLVGPSALRQGKGYFVYTRPAGDNVDDALEGQWGLGANETGNEWNCVKQRNVQPDLSSIGPAPEAGGPTGDWK